MIETNAAQSRVGAADPMSGERAADDAVTQAMAGLAAYQGRSLTKSAELRYRLTMLLFPVILLVFVALYVTSLASGVDPEVGLFRAGAVALVLAVLGRAAIGILGADTRLVLDDQQIVEMARSGSVRDYLAAAGQHRDAPDAAATAPPSATAQAATTQTTRSGGKE